MAADARGPAPPTPRSCARRPSSTATFSATPTSSSAPTRAGSSATPSSRAPANVPALLQIAAYAAQLREAGCPHRAAGAARPRQRVTGATSRSPTSCPSTVAAGPARAHHRRAPSDADEPGRWGDSPWLACGRCEVCEAEVEAARDLLLVAGRAPEHPQASCSTPGITTIDDAGRVDRAVDGRPESRSSDCARRPACSWRSTTTPDGARQRGLRPRHRSAGCRRPAPATSSSTSRATRSGPSAARGDWGLEYLFGVVEVDSGDRVFRAFWAHDREQEKQALDRLPRATSHERRAAVPTCTSTTTRPTRRPHCCAWRRGTASCEDDVDQLLRDGVFVDLYAVVRGAHPGLAALVLDQEARAALHGRGPRRRRHNAATTRSSSTTEFMTARDRRALDDAAQQMLDEIADYNRVRLRLHPAAARLAARAGSRRAGGRASAASRPRRDDRSSESVAPHSTLETACGRWSTSRADERTPEEQAVALVAAAVAYHPREDKPFWWEHFDRLSTRRGLGATPRDVVVVEAAERDRATGTQPRAAQRADRRIMRLRGDLGRRQHAVARRQGRRRLRSTRRAARAADHLTGRRHAALRAASRSSRRVEVARRRRVLQSLRSSRTLPPRTRAYDELPVALVPARHRSAPSSIDAAARTSWPSEVARGSPGLPRDAGVDILRRIPPRLRARVPAARRGPATPASSTPSSPPARRLDDSYLAVQGPPGHRQDLCRRPRHRRLVADTAGRSASSRSPTPWSRTCSTRVVRGRASTARLVGKAPKRRRRRRLDRPGQGRRPGDVRRRPRRAGLGCVVGGTAWDFTNTGRIAARLARPARHRRGRPVLARQRRSRSRSPRQRLLLLGDPQQLPQVSPGHPPRAGRPLRARLARSMAHDVLPPDLGYFLETTWRMHPASPSPSRSCRTRASSRPRSPSPPRARSSGVEPGLHVVLVDHRGNATSRPRRPTRSSTSCATSLGRAWTDADERGADGVAGR